MNEFQRHFAVYKICEIIKAEKQPIAKDSTNGTEEHLDTVYTDVSQSINPDAAGGQNCAIEFVDIFFRYYRFYFNKSRNAIPEKFNSFCADTGQPQTFW